MNRIPTAPHDTTVRDTLVTVLNNPDIYHLDGDEEVAVWRCGHTGQLHSSPHCILKPDNARRIVNTINQLAEHQPDDWCDNCVIFADSSVAEYASIGVLDAWMTTGTAGDVIHAFSHNVGARTFVPSANLDAILAHRSHDIIAALESAHPDSDLIAEVAHIYADHTNGGDTAQTVTVAVIGYAHIDAVAWRAAGRRLDIARGNNNQPDKDLADAENVAQAMLAATLVAAPGKTEQCPPRLHKHKPVCFRNTDRRAAELLGDIGGMLVSAAGELDDAQRQIATGLRADGMALGAAMELSQLIVTAPA